MGFFFSVQATSYLGPQSNCLRFCLGTSIWTVCEILAGEGNGPHEGGGGGWRVGEGVPGSAFTGYEMLASQNSFLTILNPILVTFL